MFFIVVIGFLQMPEILIPFRLQGISYQSIVRIDLHKTAPGEIGVIFRPLYLLLTQLVGLVKAVFQLFLDLQCHV